MIVLILSIVAIHPNPGNEGATIRNIAMNSSAAIAGIESPEPTSMPMSRERVLFVNNDPVHNAVDFFELTKDFKPNC